MPESGEEGAELSDAGKEQIRLRATFLNNIGIGVILVGVFTPIIRSMYEPAVISGDLISVAATMMICFSVGGGLPLVGILILRGLSK
ncbi:hypothetical protein E2F50_10500 [Rhizobium deserti]|uniref:Uncharacterized protein n=1 Tax=Rhizobium deserti TaxID=2547961 RepID=A0A4R5UK97_9HYPH|nr:hypothetical protein [Rhizobium deserti]TDK37300.1 hypothetical protein E2F50_10500 [Rhizobium deserti]